jgi:hypothetical protein
MSNDKQQLEISDDFMNTFLGEQTKSTTLSNVTEQTSQSVEPTPATSPTSTRISGKQRKLALDEYRQTFLCPPKVQDRKPIFIGSATRDSLERIIGLFNPKMSVTGFVENLARHNLEVYGEDIEQWRKL